MYNLQKNIFVHPYHLVKPSFWPFIISWSIAGFALNLTVLVFFINYYRWFYALILIIFFLIVWWIDVIKESTYQYIYNKNIERGLKLGMILFMLSEVMLFFGFFWAFFYFSIAPSIHIADMWPPKSIECVNPWILPTANTMILVTSGVAITFTSHVYRVYLLMLGVSYPTLKSFYFKELHVKTNIEFLTKLKVFLKKNDKIDLVVKRLILKKKNHTLSSYLYQVRLGLIVTLIWAFIFTNYQLIEFIRTKFDISDSIFGSTFFMLTGLHGLHVIGGSIFILMFFIRINNGHFLRYLKKRKTILNFKLAVWYWHFVDIIWIILYGWVYIWGSTGTEKLPWFWQYFYDFFKKIFNFFWDMLVSFF